MNLPSRTELQVLLRQNGGPCVSLFMPTYRTSGADRRQGPTSLENLLGRATEALIKRGLRRPDVDEMLAQAHAIGSDTSFWQNGLADGLAVFVSRRFFRSYKVPLQLAEKLFVNDRFHVTPLLPLYSGDTRFYILAISQNEVRLLEGNRHDVHELEPKGLPKSLVDALQKVAPLDAHPRNLHDDRHDQLGHGTGQEHVRQRLERYFRELDSNLLNLIGGDQAPLVLAGIERNAAIYRQVSSYKKICDGFIDANPELMTPKKLHAEALKIVEPFLRREEDIARQQLEKLGGSDRVSTDPAEIVAAAQNGRIDSLFLKRGVEVWGQFDPTNNVTRLHTARESGDEELASLAAEHTFLNGGAVFYCEPERMPRDRPVTALLRY